MGAFFRATLSYKCAGYVSLIICNYGELGDRLPFCCLQLSCNNVELMAYCKKIAQSVHLTKCTGYNMVRIANTDIANKP